MEEELQNIQDDSSDTSSDAEESLHNTTSEAPVPVLPADDKPQDSAQTVNPKVTERITLNPEMQVLADRAQTGWLDKRSKLQLHIGAQVLLLDIQEKMYIGRSTDEQTPQNLALDLTPYGGYQRGVSRVHAVCIYRDQALYIEDLSANGTSINNFRLMPKRQYAIRNGDTVTFAKLPIEFYFVRPVQL